ncbi:MAG: hypothetical protein GEU71_01560 [Actinobacteria bacterium]|nr:hypothetical protein [Actinomycetota bacterium]
MEVKVQIVDTDESCPSLPLVDGDGYARAVIWPGIGAHLRSMHLIHLNSGAQTKEQRHPMEAVYYVIEGDAIAIDPSNGSSQVATQGSMIFVEPDTSYEIHATSMTAKIVGGPCPPDPHLYEHLKS